MLKKIFFTPFEYNIISIIIITLLIGTSDILFYLSNSNYKYCLYLISTSFFYSFSIHFILHYLNDLGNIFKYITGAFLYIYTATNLFTIFHYKSTLNLNLIAVIANTDINEIINFFNTYFSIISIIVFFIIFPLLLILSFKSKKYLKSQYILILWGLFFISLLGYLRNPELRKDLPFYKFITIKNNYSSIFAPDLKKYQLTPLLTQTKESSPQKIIIIIGESFAKSHSSLYSYEKNTNPLLQKIRNDSLLFSFNNVTSPNINTIECFKTILNTSQTNKQEVPWYKHYTIPSFFNTIGYNTIWISNQAREGICENLPSKYSQLCNESFFLKDNYILGKTIYDEEVIKKININKNKKEVFFIHLAGQHIEYLNASPSHFKIFKENEYNNYPQNQQKILSDYDNATLYNDFVIHEIIEIFKNEESILFYFPDHGQDIFNVDNEYFGHGRNTIPASKSISKEIPFIIYTSPSYQNKNPKETIIIRKSINKKFNTENFIFSVMDIVGYKFTTNNDVYRYSLFSQDQ